jgi:glycosyltransferase involved in cell wall biosynthesis
VLDDRELRERLAENGRERARDFHAAEIGRQYLELFRELVPEKSAPRPAPQE